MRHSLLSKSKSLTPDWLLLAGTVSACSITWDSSLLSDILKKSKPLDLVASGGPFDACMKGVLADKIIVWRSEESESNSLGFEQIAKIFRIAPDTQFEDAKHLSASEGKWMKCFPLGAWLYTFNNRDKKCDSSNPEFVSYPLAQTATERKLKMTPEEMRLAKEDRKFQTLIISVSVVEFSY